MIGWIKRYCFTCRERTPFEYLGTQELNGRRFDLYNCKICYTTRAFNLRNLTTKLEDKDGKDKNSKR